MIIIISLFDACVIISARTEAETYLLLLLLLLSLLLLLVLVLVLVYVYDCYTHISIINTIIIILVVMPSCYNYYCYLCANRGGRMSVLEDKAAQTCSYTCII